MTFAFRASIIVWRGPAPFLFVPVPAEVSAILASTPTLSYGWGCTPGTATVGQTRWTTSLMPRQGTYLVPVKAAVQKAEGLKAGDEVELTLEVG